MLRPFALLRVVRNFCATILSLAICKRTQQLPTMLRRLHGAFKNGSLLYSSLHVNEFRVGEQVVLGRQLQLGVCLGGVYTVYKCKICNKFTLQL